MGDGVLARAFACEIGGHHADDVRTILEEHNAGVVADAFESPGLICDPHVLGQVAGKSAFFRRRQDGEKVLEQRLPNHLAAIELFE